MSLFGAMFSGVSGLTAQSSAMGAVSDNITNVSTIGYKSTDVHFQTLVTKQVSATFYSAGGVQSKPRQRTEVQGLLQASTSQTDIAISGQGFFVVNEAARPTISNQYLYSRAGSFIMDSEGFLRNAQGYYLQAWPTDPAGNVISTDPDNIPVSNQNIISTDYLETVNLSRVGGTAAATSQIRIGANLPDADPYDPNVGMSQSGFQKTDVQFFDSLGNANTISFQYLKSPRENSWDVVVEPPSGASVLTLLDGTPVNPRVYGSQGLLEFTSRPADGSTVVIDGITYEFDDDGSFNGGNTQVDVSGNTTLAQDVSTLLAAIRAADSDFDTSNNRVALSSNSTTTLVFREDGTDAISVNPVGLLDASGTPVTRQTSAITIQKVHADYADTTQLQFAANPSNGDTIVVNGNTYTFDTTGAEAAGDGDNTIDASGTLAQTLADLEAAIEAVDPEMSGDRVRVREASNSGGVDTLVLSSLPSGSYTVDASGLTAAPTEPDGTAFASLAAITVDTQYAINFDSGGMPSSFNVAQVEVLGFASGAADMDDDAANSPRIDIDFGSIGEADGMTQYGEDFTPVFITQNGSQFGTFAGVTITTDGLVTALFDNGETRIIYKIPVATFINPNALESRTGNVWNATQASGDFTLRVADNGPAGQIAQGALEASTVDIGEEFTKMIVVQRAYSASTKVIRTADEMLEELTRVK